MKRIHARALATLVAGAGLGLFAVAPVQAAPVSTTGTHGLITPHDRMHLMTLSAPPPANISHILFLNRCANGCTVTTGNSDSRTDASDIPQQTSQLSAFSGGDAEWNQVMTCMKGIMAPFNIQVTDQDPGTADHFEVMIAGSASELQLQSGILGIADFLCQSPGQCGNRYIPNALVFDFANDWPMYGGGVTEICGTAAQEIAHAWSLDHATPASDPMTYNNYQSSLHYQNGAPCGSDCQNGQSPFGLTCSGNQQNPQNHTCMSTGQATQDEVDLITQLFGSGTPDTTPPTVMITAPTNGSQVQPGFAVRANVSDDVGVSKAELRVDGNLIGTATASPWVWNAPMTLAAGSHHVEVTAYDAAGNTAKDAVDVSYGSMCTGDSQCDNGQVCNSGVCVAGPSMTGGLGSPCMTNADCDTGHCASDGTNTYCVSPCDPMNSTCPGGFGCVMTGATTGVCWPGADSGGKGGGCDASGNSGLPIVLGLTFAALLCTRRRG